MENYGKQSTFASFLPGIAGLKGIPVWCYYVNRGQGVVSFGVGDKDHAIMEFYPAHAAYQNVKRTGFRTFIRKNGEYMEPFSDEDIYHEMNIGMNTLSIIEKNVKSGIKTEVHYFVLPEEPVGALVRSVEIQNISKEDMEVELLDGMPALIPYGVDEQRMKSVTQTAKAWMQFEKLSSGVNFYRVRASMDDSAVVKDIEGGNFAAAFDACGKKMECIADMDAIFGYDCSLEKPVVFIEGGIEAVVRKKERTANLIPGAFFVRKEKLKAGERFTINEMIGQVETIPLLDKFLSVKHDEEYFQSKKLRAINIVDDLCKGMETKTGNSDFDQYCKYTYMDNVLRGGYPVVIGKDKNFYVYSRKHGDLERDYNYFSMLPQYYSQGNGNFRDVNQNRRCDTFFAPRIGRENIRMFYSLIQLDGYNPLEIEALTYIVKEPDLLLKNLNGEKKEQIKNVITRPFMPGELLEKLMQVLEKETAEILFDEVMDHAEKLVNASFKEGYWTDHWTYNLDLIEEYLSIFPEQEKEMLLEKEYPYFLSQELVLPRRERYVETEKGLRQYHFLKKRKDNHAEEKLVTVDGNIVKVTLLEKLILLSAIKTATLDAKGMGVEMEGGKPGWYDALNGMPGIFGSSMAETCELVRNLNYTIHVLKKYAPEVELLDEVAEFVESLDKVNRNAADELDFWNRSNDLKEEYREKTFAGISGKRKTVDADSMIDILVGLKNRAEAGIKKSFTYTDGIIPTYFAYDIPKYEKTEHGIEPKEFHVIKIPYFLEGPVRMLKLDDHITDKDEMYKRIKNSDLYDSKLLMYKVNASLENASYEIGRARAFTPGWLENESIWLHMEYKYLLELLKSGLYSEFSEDFHKAAIPFLDEAVYGRSILENSSFIASSKNPDESIHGKGFVARLSGSTIEFISMWKMMMFGENPFYVEKGELCCQFKPVIPAYLIGEDRIVSAQFLSKTLVEYHFSDVRNYFPGTYKIGKIELMEEDGKVTEIHNDVIKGALSKEIREGNVKKISVWM